MNSITISFKEVFDSHWDIWEPLVNSIYSKEEYFEYNEKCYWLLMNPALESFTFSMDEDSTRFLCLFDEHNIELHPYKIEGSWEVWFCYESDTGNEPIICGHYDNLEQIKEIVDEIYRKHNIPR